MTNVLNEPIFRTVSLLAIGALLFGCGGSGKSGGGNNAYAYTIPRQYTDGWTTADANAEGVNVNALTDMMNTIRRQGTDAFLRHVLIVKNNKLVFEEYFGSSNIDALSHLQSATKSVVSAVFGIVRDNGYVTSLDDAVFDYFPEYSQYNDPDKANITLQHILTMTPGFEWNELTSPTFSGENDNMAAYGHGNYIEYVLRKDLVDEPGMVWTYNSGCPMILAGIIRNQTGMHIDEYADLNLLTPLGIERRTWEYQNDGLPLATGGLWLRARDSAKIGQVFLDDGVWQGAQIISSDWVSRSLTAAASVDQWVEYGYLWWTREIGGQRIWFASGYGGQYIFIVPDIDAVIIINNDYVRDTAESGRRDSATWELMNDYIIPSL